MRDIQGIIIWVVFLVWIGVSVYVCEWLDADVWAALGMGVVTGILCKMLSDMWQFYWRKKQDSGKK